MGQSADEFRPKPKEKRGEMGIVVAVAFRAEAALTRKPPAAPPKQKNPPRALLLPRPFPFPPQLLGVAIGLGTTANPRWQRGTDKQQPTEPKGKNIDERTKILTRVGFEPTPADGLEP